MATGTISATDVAKAAAELASMKRSLRSWLRFRAMNDGVLAGTAKTTKPLAYGQRVVSAARDMSLEQDIATKLAALLATVEPDMVLPNPDVNANPDAAVQLATIAVTGAAPPLVASPTAQGGIFSASTATHPWLWPVLIVGALLIAFTTAVKTAADVATQKEQDACIEAGACTDYGFWLKAGGIVVLAWFAWRELGLGDVVKSVVASKKRRS